MGFGKVKHRFMFEGQCSGEARVRSQTERRSARSSRGGGEGGASLTSGGSTLSAEGKCKGPEAAMCWPSSRSGRQASGWSCTREEDRQMQRAVQSDGRLL